MADIKTLRDANNLATRFFEMVKGTDATARQCRREAKRLRNECKRVEADKNLGGALAMWRAAAKMLDLQAKCLEVAA